MSHDSPRRRVVAAPPRRPPAELHAIRVICYPDPEPDVSYLEQEDFEERFAAYKREEFSIISVRVEAEVTIAGIRQTLRSSGLGGIESDLDDEELEDFASQEWSALRVVLKTVGVPTEQLPLEVEREWIEWRI